MKHFKILIFFSFILFLSCSDNKDDDILKSSGTIETINVTISSKISGQIKEQYFNEGDKVKTGDLLMKLDHELLDIQLRQMEAGVEVANAQLNLLLSGARKEDVLQAQDILKQAKINLDAAKTDFNRFKILYDSNSVTKKQYEDALTRYNISLAQYNSAKENLEKVKTIVRPQEIETARANLKKSIAAVDLIKKNIEECKIYSPVDGYITKRFVEAGENITPSTSLMQISNLKTVELVIYVSEIALGKIKVGQNADIKIDSFKDKTYKGKIIFISPEAEFTPKNIQTEDERTKLVFAVKIQIPNPELELKSGMPADAYIKISQQP